MPRGRTYYDPVVQVPGRVEDTTDLARIEFYPELDGSGQIGRWVGRRIDHDGRVVGYTAGNFDHDAELAHAMELWPGLEVFELPDEQTDSTWEGTGPSPRIWAQAAESVPPVENPVQELVADAFKKATPDETREMMGEIGRLADTLSEEPQAQLRIMPITEPGNYVLLEDIRALLEMWAVAYEVDKNPSGALALRDAVDALKNL